MVSQLRDRITFLTYRRNSLSNPSRHESLVKVTRISRAVFTTLAKETNAESSRRLLHRSRTRDLFIARYAIFHIPRVTLISPSALITPENCFRSRTRTSFSSHDWSLIALDDLPRERVSRELRLVKSNLRCVERRANVYVYISIFFSRDTHTHMYIFFCAP